jgi:hypothetical protein
MVGIARSINKSISDFEIGDTEFSMMHACMVIDATAKKTYPKMKDVGPRFKQLLRENYEILGPLGITGVDLAKTKWPVEIRNSKGKKIIPDMADIIYSIHRCTHGHGEELPQGFELTKESGILPYATTDIESGVVKLSDCVIFALLAIAVVAPVNSSLSDNVGYYLMFHGDKYPLNEWWGRRQDFIKSLLPYSIPAVIIDFAHMMDVTKEDNK